MLGIAGVGLLVLAPAAPAPAPAPAAGGPGVTRNEAAVFAAVGGFRHATDPNVSLVCPRTGSLASVEMDFRIGVELDGVSGTRWALYQLDSGRLPGIPGLGGTPRRDVPPPATVPWRVKR